MTSKERVAYLKSLRFWLIPGMGVKRHVLFAVLGALLLFAGAAGLLLWFLGGNREVVSEPIEQILVGDRWQRSGHWLMATVSLFGLVLAIGSIGRLNRSLLSNWLPRPSEAAIVLHRKLSLSRGPRIVALGGGTGLSNLLRGLRNYSSNLSAVVTVTDDGGSSGRLRDAFDMPAPGDLSDCLAALSDREAELARLLQYRFRRGGELEGHSFGNLLITTLKEVEGDLAEAVRVLNHLLSLVGNVYPSTSEVVRLNVVKEDGTFVRGESEARKAPGAIRRVSIEPESPRASSEVVMDILATDLVVLGPGSLFTSTIPPLLVPGIKRALLQTSAPLVYVCNIMTEAGETDGFDAIRHVEMIGSHLGRKPDWVIINSTPVDIERQRAYRLEGAEVVSYDPAVFAGAGITLIELDLLGPGPHAQHDSEQLASWLAGFAKRHSSLRQTAEVSS
ncbi:MAG: uridine diphosphate-N-acetylglucosamine-binding protein YvcK [Trueperaceae bacterium]|nr:MAG: uridine diphosphate-N-acetylglucosamine-binding protein YvcK [Trueperaceae bacterium]